MGYKVKDSKRYIGRKLKDSLGIDILRYLAELITNADDSYKRLEKQGTSKIDGRIIVSADLKKRDQGYSCIFSVTDFAEGMSYSKLKEVFSEYGNDNAGGVDGHVRGIFGQGASDVLRNACTDNKTAMIESIHDGMYTRLKYTDKGDYDYELEIDNPIPANNGIRERLGIDNNGTRITFGVPDKVDFIRYFTKKDRKNLPQLINKYPTFRYLLDEKYSNRKVFFKRNDNIFQEKLDSTKYGFVGEPVFEKIFKVDYQDKKVSCHLSLFKKTNNEDDAKIIVRDENYTVYDNTGFSVKYLLGDFVGELVIDDLYKICYEELNSDEPEAIFKDNRTGFDTSKTFYKIIDKAIYPLVTTAVDKNKDAINLTENKDYKSGLSALNKYIKQLLKEDNIGGGDISNEPPASGIKFVRSDLLVTKGKKYGLKLLINSNLIGVNDKIKIELENNEKDNIELTPIEVTYENSDIPNSGLVIKNITIYANEITEVPVKITANCGEYNTSAYISVADLDIHYPEDGLEFYPGEVNLVFDKPHTVKLYVDTEIVSVGSKIFINRGGLFGESLYEVTENCLIGDTTIGVIDVTLTGGEVGETYTVEAMNNDLKASVIINLVESSEQKNKTNGLITSFQLKEFPTPDFQSFLDPNTGIVWINTANTINQKMLGDIKKLKIKDQKYSKEQNKYICDIITTTAAKELVKKREIRHGDIIFDESGECADQIRNCFQIYKNDMFGILFSKLIKESIDIEN